MAKLIHAKRGGYCFEQNALFAAVLETAGFPVKRLAARVRMGSTEIRPRSHMLLAVEADGDTWLADVGFGGEGLLLPVRLRPNHLERHFGWQYRVVMEGSLYVLQSLTSRRVARSSTAFTLEEQYPADYEVSKPTFTSDEPAVSVRHETYRTATRSRSKTDADKPATHGAVVRRRFSNRSARRRRGARHTRAAFPPAFRGRHSIPVPIRPTPVGVALN